MLAFSAFPAGNTPLSVRGQGRVRACVAAGFCAGIVAIAAPSSAQQTSRPQASAPARVGAPSRASNDTPTLDYTKMLYNRLLRNTASPAGYMLSFTGGNTLPPGWIIQTNSRQGGSRAYLDAVKSLIATAQTNVDITTLGPIPDPGSGYFNALKEAIDDLNSKGRPVTVRFVFGQYLSPSWNIQQFLSKITEGIRARAARTVNVEVTSIMTDRAARSWNHSKIVAVDGERVIVGGHNFYSADYLTSTPIFDLSMRVDGPAAAAATRYASVLWRYGCTYSNNRAFGWMTGSAAYLARPNNIQPVCSLADPPALPPPPAEPAPPGQVNVLAAPHAGLGMMQGIEQLGDIWKGSPVLQWGDEARDQSFRMAQRTIRVSQQAITFPATDTGRANGDMMEALAQAIMRNVDVYIVVSNLDAGLYASKTNVARVALEIYDRIRGRPGARDKTCQYLHLTTIALPGTGTRIARHWPNGAGVGNHAKFYMVDDRLFYIGSQNMYPPVLGTIGANQEYGFLIDNVARAQELLTSYWNPLWAASGRDPYIGREVRCPLPPGP